MPAGGTHRELVHPDLVVWAVDSVAGAERALAEAIFAKQPDLVYLTHAASSSVQRFTRAGIPSIAGPSAVWWERLSPQATPDAPPLWQQDGGDWTDPRQQAIEALLPSASPLRDQDDRFLLIDGQALLRKDANGNLTATSRPLTVAAAQALAVALASEMPMHARVLIPSDQVELGRRLALAGFLPAQPCEAWLLTPLLRRSARPVLLRPFSVSEADVAAFGQQSGDLNPLHFDDAFARAHGFERRISHGMLFSGWLTKLLGTDYPGPGTVFLGNSSVFHAPVYPDQPYEVRVSTPLADPARNVYRIAAQLRDATGKLVTLSYSDVMHRPATAAG